MRAGLTEWLDDYGRAWEARDSDAAAALFAEDAVYQWGPFGDRLRGRPVIRTAWDKWSDTKLFDEFARIDAIKGKQAARLTAVADRHDPHLAGRIDHIGHPIAQIPGLGVLRQRGRRQCNRDRGAEECLLEQGHCGFPFF